jgi:type IV pilus assembly protein PilC
VTKLLTDIRATSRPAPACRRPSASTRCTSTRCSATWWAPAKQAGILDDLLDRLAIYKEKMLAIKGKIKSALFYPIAVLVVAFVVVTVIMMFVIPAFKEVFESFGADLPAPTLMVIAMSDFFVSGGT